MNWLDTKAEVNTGWGMVELRDREITGEENDRMTQKEKVVSLEDARHQVEIAVTRLALLHLSFSRTLVDEFGEEKAKDLIVKSILDYGKRVGERVKRGLPDLPRYGVYGGSKNGRVYDCILAKVFQEYGEQKIGCLYCYVDPAKAMTADLDRKVIHTRCAACGDDYCTFQEKLTTEKERKDFLNRDRDWKFVDPRLVKGS